LTSGAAGNLLDVMPAELLAAIYPDVPWTGGPGVATAYLDTSRNVPKAAQMIDTRWQAARSELAAAGADQATLDALAAAVGGHREPGGPPGQVLVGAGGKLLYDGTLPHPPRRATTRWAPLPHLMPLVAQFPPVVPYVLVVADRVGAQIEVHGPGADQEQSVSGRDWPVHKAHAGGWSELRHQHKVENTWQENARQVAEVVDNDVRRIGARLLLLAGEVRARAELARALDERSRAVLAEIEAGGRGDENAERALEREVQQLVAQAAAAQDAAVVERYRQESGQRDRAAAGLAATLTALWQSQVETLLVVDDPSADATAWVGPEPVQLALTGSELRDLGVPDPRQDRLDAALVRAAAGTHANVVTLAAGQLDLSDGLGAVLRY
jgi:hypothetical protein